MNPKMLAIQTAFRSKHPKSRLGAVLVVGGKIISARPNLPAPGSMGICAEQNVLRQLPREAYCGNRILYVARITRDGVLALACPCERCQAFIRNKKILKVFHTTNEGGWKKME